MLSSSVEPGSVSASCAILSRPFARADRTPYSTAGDSDQAARLHGTATWRGSINVHQVRGFIGTVSTGVRLRYNRPHCRANDHGSLARSRDANDLTIQFQLDSPEGDPASVHVWYARLGRELVGCKSPVRKRTSAEGRFRAIYHTRLAPPEKPSPVHPIEGRRNLTVISWLMLIPQATLSVPLRAGTGPAVRYAQQAATYSTDHSSTPPENAGCSSTSIRSPSVFTGVISTRFRRSLAVPKASSVGTGFQSSPSR